MKRCFLSLFAILWAITSFAVKNQPLRGRVGNNRGEAVAGAVVSCIELPDSTVVAYCITDADGLFYIDAVRDHFEKYLLEVSFLGYEKSYVTPTPQEMVITLKESVLTIGEVTVTALAPVLKQKPGRFIYTPPFSAAEGIDSYELLRCTPLMTLENNTVSILGKGTSTIYVNGRKPVMDNASLMEMLRATPADQIGHIEIITAPNSSYKASTTGGIVNIVMKKDPNQGLTGSASISGTYLGERISPRATLYLGYSKNKFNASANLGYFYQNSLNKTDAVYNYKESFTDILNETTEQAKGHFLDGNISLAYDLTKRSTAGASFHIGGSECTGSSATGSSCYLNGKPDRYSASVNETDNPFQRPEIGVVAYYNLKTDPNGSNLDISANYSSSISTPHWTMRSIPTARTKRPICGFSKTVRWRVTDMNSRGAANISSMMATASKPAMNSMPHIFRTILCAMILSAASMSETRP